MNIPTTELSHIADAIESLNSTLSEGAHDTNWTIPDSLSAIAYQLGRIADSMEKNKHITK